LEEVPAPRGDGHSLSAVWAHRRRRLSARIAADRFLRSSAPPPLHHQRIWLDKLVVRTISGGTERREARGGLRTGSMSSTHLRPEGASKLLPYGGDCRWTRNHSRRSSLISNPACAALSGARSRRSTPRDGRACGSSTPCGRARPRSSAPAGTASRKSIW